jgi:integrase
MTRNDILSYLDSPRKPEASDPLHRFIGTYNLRRINITNFFKWLYYPDILPSANRPIPDVVKNIAKLMRTEISTIKPTALWTEEDDYLFLKFCPSVRDKTYHTIARDSSCRPSELLRLRIKNINFMLTVDKKQYAQITVNGKTGTRNIPLFNSVPYQGMVKCTSSTKE